MKRIMKRFGIDISKWQGDFNFTSAKAEGVTFAIIKGGGADDGLYVDPKFEQNYAAAKQNNIPVGCYWFSRATSIVEAEKEADFFYSSILKGKQFELPVFIDVEHSDMLSLGSRLLTDIVEKFCSYLENRSFFVGIYSTSYVFSRYMLDDELKRYTHWVAEWAKSCSYSDSTVLGIWQFGGETNLIRSNKVAHTVCDQNYMYFDFEQAIKLLGLNGFTKDAPVFDAIPEKLPLKIGDTVSLDKDAVVYNTQIRFAPFVYNSTLYVRDIQNDRIVISTQKTGAVTGAVDVKYLIR